MSKNAIYDDKNFFDSYIELRGKQFNYNDLIEQPMILELLGDLSGKTVLDIGCGFGAMVAKVKQAGASSVLGIDVSHAMIEKAIAENSGEGISYAVHDVQHLSKLDGKFDVVVSCLTLHYVEDFEKVFADVKNLLNEGGKFVFSIEHPMYTASKYPQKWLTDENGKEYAFATDHYGEEGQRNISWLGRPVLKYHHKVETVINALINNGYKLAQIAEPTPSKQLMDMVPKTVHELHRPAYLAVKCFKG